MDEDEEYILTEEEEEENIEDEVFLQQEQSQCTIHCTKSNGPLVFLQKISTWEVLLNAAQIRNNHAILEKVHALQPDEIPTGMQYHRECYQQFTNKSSLDVLRKKSKFFNENLRTILAGCTSYETDEPFKPKRSSSNSSSSSTLLPNVCIICNQTLKYKKRKPEPLRKCEVINAREKLETCAREKGDHRMLSIVSTTNIVAAEVKYHPSCYTNYTRPKKNNKVQKDVEQNQAYKRVELEAFQLSVEHCYNSMVKSKVIRLQELVAIMTEHFRVNDLLMTPSTKKNLRRNLWREIEVYLGEEQVFFVFF